MSVASGDAFDAATSPDPPGGPLAENVCCYASGLPLLYVVDRQRGY